MSSTARALISPLEPRAPGASIVCGYIDTGASVPEPELYMLSAINHKLDAYPGLAVAVGLDTVSNCDDARRYVEAYTAYALDNPGFAAEEQGVPLPEGEPEPSHSGPPETQIQKIANGTNAADDPIVRLEFPIWPQTDDQKRSQPGDASWGTDAAGNVDPESDPRGKTVTCTGTFINRNWIVTAAHCLSYAAVNGCIFRGLTRAQCQPDWAQWGQWTIRGARNGTGYVMRNVEARGYVHSKWYGTTWSQNPAFCPPKSACYSRALGATHDLALLYVPTDQDDRLAANLEENGAKRLSIIDPDPSWSLTFAGWGDPVQTDPQGNAVAVLRASNPSSSFSVIKPDMVNAVLTATISTPTAPYPCPGDSGGPLMRTGLQMATNAGTKTGLEAVVGVMSHGYSLCAPLDDQPFFWTLVSSPGNLGFIEDTMRRWPPYDNLVCPKRPVNGDPIPPAGPPASVEECWGTPCVANGPPARFRAGRSAIPALERPLREAAAASSGNAWIPPRHPRAQRCSLSAASPNPGHFRYLASGGATSRSRACSRPPHGTLDRAARLGSVVVDARDVRLGW